MCYLVFIIVYPLMRLEGFVDWVKCFFFVYLYGIVEDYTKNTFFYQTTIILIFIILYIYSYYETISRLMFVNIYFGTHIIVWEILFYFNAEIRFFINIFLHALSENWYFQNYYQYFYYNYIHVYLIIIDNYILFLYQNWDFWNFLYHLFDEEGFYEDDEDDSASSGFNWYGGMFHESEYEKLKNYFNIK